MTDPTHASPIRTVTGAQPVSPASKTQNAQAAQATYAQLMVQQDETMEKLTQVPQNNFNPALLNRTARPLRERIPTRGKEEAEATKTEETAEEESVVIGVEKIDELAETYHREHEELDKNELQLLRGKISKKDTPQEILDKVLDSFPDVSIADEALNYLIDTSSPDLAETVKEAKELLNQKYSREVKAGKNIAVEVKDAATEGLGTHNELRDLYREITGNPRPPATLFEELAEKYTYSELRGVIKFLLHALGADLKAKGPSIAKGELFILFKEVRTLQAILGIYLFFMSRSPLLDAEFLRMGLSKPLSLNFEALAKLFVKLIQDRFPSAEKALMLLTQFNLSKYIPAQIMILQQMRDAINNISKNLYRNDQHKKDVQASLLTCLSDLEDLLEEAEEQEEEAEEERRRKKRQKEQKDQQQ